jgi:hypothetical protein
VAPPPPPGTKRVGLARAQGGGEQTAHYESTQALGGWGEGLEGGADSADM